MSICNLLVSHSTGTHIVSNISRRVIHDVIRHPRQCIPTTRPTAFIFRGAFDLESRASDSPPAQCQPLEHSELLCNTDIPEVFRERPRLVLRHERHLLASWERAVIDRRRWNQRTRRNKRRLVDGGCLGDFYGANEQVPDVLEAKAQLEHRRGRTRSCRAV